MLEKGLIETIRESEYTVVLSGQGMVCESGYPALRDDEESYEIEEKYGYSVEELYSSAIFNTRTDLFYHFFREVLLEQVMTIEPGPAFQYLAEMQQSGMVDTIITRRIFELSERAGCTNVINLHGSIFDYKCPHCGRKYSMDDIMHSKKNIPVCPDCNVAIRPDIVLLGEMVDNALMTKAAEEVEKADVLLVLGARMNSTLVSMMTPYYKGNKLIVITPDEHFSEYDANMVIHSSIADGLKQFL
ncbi:MAG: NAD-dependent deacetylase [Hespellia sp.]|nr:NAD-dependent deacetylase [Hespellia sp.]